MSLIFLVGGARSGKSSLAVELARESQRSVTVIVTAESRDEEMEERIRRHREARPAAWRTVEAPFELRGSLEAVPTEDVLVVDCLSFWVANVLERGDSDEEVEREAASVAQLAAARSAFTVAVSNEVGLGVVPVNGLARRYRDLLGRVNATWAQAADEAAFVVAGRVLRLDKASVLRA